MDRQKQLRILTKPMYDDINNIRRMVRQECVNSIISYIKTDEWVVLPRIKSHIKDWDITNIRLKEGKLSFSNGKKSRPLQQIALEELIKIESFLKILEIGIS